MKDTERNLYTHNIGKIPSIVNCAKEVFAGKKLKLTKSLPEYKAMKENKDKFLNSVSSKSDSVSFESKDGVNEVLSVLSHLYLDCFFIPVHAFIPHTSVCSGQWGFWDEVDYLKLRASLGERGFVRDLALKIKDSSVWNTKMKPDDFPLIVKRRLIREKLLGKPLDSAAMIKAMIIRLGELCKPSISYEIIDYVIRDVFTYLGVKRYLRIDREIKFLRLFEREIKGILGKIEG